ncbi:MULTISPECIES: hypothetical protein [unclassified Vibrio]|uniref:Lipoprotein n=1 Tax=Vibrio sp. HB236076 TaxID=3232307 RepID=A0AB39HH55_9VIBR|nr:hypothetical protein [Vibrio sp. HB161653]MDP5254359.1 hypothetical protein [Vibrio sp. HB161653]
MLKKITFCLALGLTLSACAYKPREVSADIPLVSPNSSMLNGQLIAKKYWPQLDDATTQSLTAENVTISVSAPYFSALGNTCRTLEAQLSNGDDRVQIACSRPYKGTDADPVFNPVTPWYLTPSLNKGETLPVVQ